MKFSKLFLILLLIGGLSTFSWAQSGQEINYNYSNFEKANRVELYPNPTVDFLNITISNSTLSAPVIEVFNILGNKVNVEVEKTSDNQYQLNVKDLPAGYYLISIKEKGSTPIKDMFKFLKR